MEWILNLCRELRPWYELSQNAVSGHGHVLRYCQLRLRRNDTFRVAISNSICVLLMMTTLAAFWDISIYGLSLMPYIEIMLNVVRAFGKVTCVWPLFLISIKYGMNPEFVQRIETMVWVVAKCGFRTWPCFALLPTMTLRRNDTFWVAISNSICVLLMMT